jgi:hypothetical protein
LRDWRNVEVEVPRITFGANQFEDRAALAAPPTLHGGLKASPDRQRLQGLQCQCSDRTVKHIHHHDPNAELVAYAKKYLKATDLMQPQR